MSEKTRSFEDIKMVVISLALLAVFAFAWGYGYGQFEAAHMIMRGAYATMVALGSALLFAGALQIAGVFEPKDD
ncbi:MAG: hypothetical protein FNT29_05495 [Halothiobacillaceae bacterium]|nr:MAG: hypothetical protein FNT29_05495 [Halothiobacillaceae bacterium]